MSAHGRIMRASFRPHPLISGAHRQTIIPALWRPTPKLDLDVERWELEDGDFVDLGWFARPSLGQPTAVLVHGLTGDFSSKYLRGTALRLMQLGWAGLILKLRGAGEEPNRLPRAYHQGQTDDLHALLKHLKSTNPVAPLAVIGWSLGGNLVLKAAGEAGDAFAADEVIAASVPFELESCALSMRQGFSRVYQRRLMNDLKLSAQRKADAVNLPQQVDLAATLAARDWFEFDQAWTAPLNGFDGFRDYYERCACGQYLADIQVPTLIVHSLDDPFMNPGIVPKEQQLSAQVSLELSRRGGHVGFIAANAWGGPHYWLETRIARQLAQSSSLAQALDS